MTTQPLSELTTIGVGGVPERLWVATTRDEVLSMAREMWAEADEWLVIGGGSNIVAADELPNLQVLKVATQGVETTRVGETNQYILRVQAGENWDDLVAATVESKLAGLEALSGIPGSVGAAPVQNIGAYGGEVANSLQRVEFLDYLTGETEIIEAQDLGFGYRQSIFKGQRQGIITWAEFKLEHLGGLSQPIIFPQLAKALAVDLGTQVELSKVRSAVLSLRASKGMVLDPADPDTASCGSFFINPVVSDRMARTLPFDAPKFENPADEGLTVKLSAAWLIENSGIARGYRIPGSNAGVSTKHSLAITNRGGATSAEVLQLAEFIKVRVANKFGIELQPEPNLIGF
jgi:UDP-N-acetylmuramate dehydrogenase